jgi:C4-dicarboxylate-specific signal transduction histidine kinase
MAVTEREVAQRSIAARDAALDRAMRMATAGELAATVAHELNQPLSAIGTYVRACALMLERPAAGPLLRETLDKVGREVGRAAEVIRHLREFYRTGAARRESVAPAALIAAAVESLKPRLAYHGIETAIDVPSDLPPIDVDKIRVQAVLHNLLANAVEALAGRVVPGRRIRVAARVEERRGIVFEIADNGPGISADVASRLFEPLTSTKPDGMGLGLAISHSIVEAHGGSLRHVPGAGTGATFELTLPFMDEDQHDIDA